MASITDKVKHALHMDKDKSTSTTHSTTTHGNNVPEGTAGPHNSRIGNAADPRVDSDMDGSNRHTGTHTGAGLGHTTGTTGTHTGAGIGHTGAGIGHSTHTTGHSTTGAGYGSSAGPAAGTAGPHSSNLLNKADPTVDSDLSGGNHMGAQSDSRTAGYTGTGTTGAGYGSSATHGTHTGTAGTGYGTTGSHGSTNAGPHNSNVLNKVDPRVDSDLDGSNRHTGTGAGYGSTHTGTHTGTTGAGFGSTGTHGGISHSTNAGPHNSNIANKADPRVDSDLDGRGGHVGRTTGGITGASGSHATPGSGTSQNTAGPHNSDMLNKLDPRVDSDLSGGKTYGGNATHQ